MKITQIDVRNLLIPLKVPYALQKSYGIKSHTCCVMVAVHTDEGIVGYGECNPQPGFTDESAETAKSVIGSILAPAIMGMDPTDVAAIDRRMDVVCKNNNLPKAAVNTACYDIAGKAAGVPVYKLLGGKLQDSIPIMHAIGNVSAEDGAKLVLQRKNEGYRSVMVKCGMESVEYDAERIFAIQEAVGKDYPLVADVNQGWDYHKALRFLRLTEGCNIVCLEQPVPHWDIDSLARLKALSLADVADELGLNISTISRAVRGKYLSYPGGVVPLSFFFVHKAGTDSADRSDMGNAAVCEVIREIVADENRKHPLSDQNICSKLAARGIRISRRTVAKYRDKMMIPAAAERRED